LIILVVTVGVFAAWFAMRRAAKRAHTNRA